MASKEDADRQSVMPDLAPKYILIQVMDDKSEPDIEIVGLARWEIAGLQAALEEYVSQPEEEEEAEGG